MGARRYNHFAKLVLRRHDEFCYKRRDKIFDEVDMIKFEDLLTLIGSRLTVLLIFLASAVVSIALNKYDPTLFKGLPAWVLPALRLFVIFSSVALVTALFGPVVSFLERVFRLIAKPYRETRLQKVPLNLSVEEILILGMGIVEQMRKIRLQQNHATVISPVDIGLSEKEPFSLNSVSMGHYDIPKIVFSCAPNPSQRPDCLRQSCLGGTLRLCAGGRRGLGLRWR